MYNNAGTIGGAAAGAGVASAQVLPDTGGLALMPLTGTILDRAPGSGLRPHRRWLRTIEAQAPHREVDLLG